jgi:hypothetical protein
MTLFMAERMRDRSATLCSRRLMLCRARFFAERMLANLSSRKQGMNPGKGRYYSERPMASQAE